MSDSPHGQQHPALGGTAVVAETMVAVTTGTNSPSQADLAAAAEIMPASSLPAGGDSHPSGDISMDGVTLFTAQLLHAKGIAPSDSGSPRSRMDMSLWISSITSLSRVNHSLIKLVIISA